MFARLQPKRFGDRLLDGPSFAKLIKDVLDAFNSKKVPELVSSVERIIEQERRDSMENLKQFIDKYLKEHLETDNDIVSKSVSALWEKVTGLASRKRDF